MAEKKNQYIFFVWPRNNFAVGTARTWKKTHKPARPKSTGCQATVITDARWTKAKSLDTRNKPPKAGIWCQDSLRLRDRGYHHTLQNPGHLCSQWCMTVVLASLRSSCLAQGRAHSNSLELKNFIIKFSDLYS